MTGLVGGRNPGSFQGLIIALLKKSKLVYLETVADIDRNVCLGPFKLRYLDVLAGFIQGAFQFADGIVTFASIRKIGVGITRHIFTLALYFQYIVAAVAAPARKSGALINELAFPKTTILKLASVPFL